ncbi:MAG TPA: phosphoglucosamine mutase [Candidatus Limnocylindrales bacterium]|jgi:phosphoglucosamine mutase|nr:phosphoglucosamine mutase [Candidatus Limnocylindrales bacterium]
MRKLFGTDGIRGVAGEYPLDKATVFNIGRALGDHLPAGPRRVVIGQDTRDSSAWIAEMLSSGLGAAKVEVASAGVITTPGVAYITHTQKFSAGVVISASHNPWRDNGIKVFGPDGFKLPDSTELEIEKEIFALAEKGDGFVGGMVTDGQKQAELRGAYINWLARPIARAEKLKVVVDCANGAASAIAPEVFTSCGVNAQFTHNSPSGRNINENCGALHPDVVGREVVQRGADLGICFDGDADRALFTDSSGKVVNGDAVMLLLAEELKSRGELAQNTVVATTMSNMGLEIALRNLGIEMRRAPVGDKYVLEEMQKTGAVLGGEQSGHIILSREATTGDGLLTAIRVLEVVCKRAKPLAELVSPLKVFPQTIKNVRVREKKPLAQLPEIMAAIRKAEGELKGNGRVNVRYSGTESLARVMVEAESEQTVQRIAGEIASILEQVLGTGVAAGHQ